MSTGSTNLDEELYCQIAFHPSFDVGYHDKQVYAGKSRIAALSLLIIFN